LKSYKIATREQSQEQLKNEQTFAPNRQTEEAFFKRLTKEKNNIASLRSVASTDTGRKQTNTKP
jgi:hypothetical protein